MHTDTLDEIWWRIDSDELLVLPHEWCDWHSEDLRALQDAGWLVESNEADSVLCASCGEFHAVQFSHAKNQPVRRYFVCPDARIVDLAASDVLTYRIDLARIVHMIAASLGTGDHPHGIHPSMIWELGALNADGEQRTAYFARQLNQAPWPTDVGLAPDSVVIVPSVVPANEAWPIPPHAVASLLSVARWEDGQLFVDAARCIHRPLARLDDSDRKHNGVAEGARVVRWRDDEHRLMKPLSRKEQTVLDALLRADQIPLSQFVHARKSALWRYDEHGRHRKQVQSFLHEIAKKLKSASPSLRLRFSLPRGSDMIYLVED